MDSFAERFSAALDASEFNAAELAAKLGVSKTTVGNWKKGRGGQAGRAGGINVNYLFEVARLLRVNARWLATGEGHRRAMETDRLSGLALSHAALYDQLPQSQRVYIDSMMQSFEKMLAMPDSQFKRLMLGDFGSDRRQEFQGLLMAVTEKYADYKAEHPDRIEDREDIEKGGDDGEG